MWPGTLFIFCELAFHVMVDTDLYRSIAGLAQQSWGNTGKQDDTMIQWTFPETLLGFYYFLIWTLPAKSIQSPMES